MNVNPGLLLSFSPLRQASHDQTAGVSRPLRFASCHVRDVNDNVVVEAAFGTPKPGTSRGGALPEEKNHCDAVRGLAIPRIARTIISVAGLHVLHNWRPVYMLWGLYGLLIGTRWFVGILVPALFVWMAGDCIHRRSTQSATGILYVAGVLIFIGEIVALYLTRETGMPL